MRKNITAAVVALILCSLFAFGLTGCASSNLLIPAQQIAGSMFGFDSAMEPEETSPGTAQNVSAFESKVVKPSQQNPQSKKNNKDTRVINFAMFGVDTRDSSALIGDQYRSDTIILVSLDIGSNNIRIISVMRDSKVPIEGHDPQKINAAYKYGGHELALQTLNENFGLELEDYLSVDFGHLQQIIDIFGGVDMEITAEEAALINEYAMALGHSEPDAVEGLCHLDGAQAVSYSRIRAIDSDYYRVERQQKVLEELMSQVREMSFSEYIGLMWEVLKCVETSFSLYEIYSFVSAVSVSDITFEAYTMPNTDVDPNLWGGIDEHGEWVWIFDIDAVGEEIRSIIGRGDKAMFQNIHYERIYPELQ